MPKITSVLVGWHVVTAAWHHVERWANNRIEADHSRLKHRLRLMRGLRTDRTATVIPPVTRRTRQLRLYLNYGLILGQYPASEDIPIGWLHIEPTYLARAIHHYVEYPQDRTAIGTEDGLRQLSAAINPTAASTPTRVP